MILIARGFRSASVVLVASAALATLEALVTIVVIKAELATTEVIKERCCLDLSIKAP